MRLQVRCTAKSAQVARGCVSVLQPIRATPGARWRESRGTVWRLCPPVDFKVLPHHTCTSSLIRALPGHFFRVIHPRMARCGAYQNLSRGS
jgi:hypothetical protein